MPIDGVKRAEMSDYTYRKIIIDRDGVATGEKIINVPDEVVKQIRADAIEEFVKAIEKHQTRQDSYLDPPYVEMGLDMVDVLEVAEKLKEQNK